MTRAKDKRAIPTAKSREGGAAEAVGVAEARVAAIIPIVIKSTERYLRRE